MAAIDVDGLTFTFPRNWEVSKYDEWTFYRKHFLALSDRVAAVDVLAVSPQGDAYLIEVKDYRHPDTERPTRLPDAIANKVLCTMAAILPAKLRANDAAEQSLSKHVLGCQSLSVVLHVEQPRAHLPVVDLADLKQKLKAKLRAVDPHPKIVSMAKMQNLPWNVI
jgi:hypothetical protein